MLKDFVLSTMVKSGYNVAKYCSISSKTGDLRVVHGVQYGEDDSKVDIISRLIMASNNKSVNVRSFSKESVSGNRFVMGLSSVKEVLNVIEQNTKDGLDSIVNENIDIMDHGVSGVILGDIIEFSPYDTPRCVEKDGTCRLGLEMGIDILESVYGLNLSVLRTFDSNQRVEFSIHPDKQGVYDRNVIIWEISNVENMPNYKDIKPQFPNRFSRMLGDKVFGLLLLHHMGYKVPYCTIVNRHVAPFSIGTKTFTGDKWTRTAPYEKQGGLFDTIKGYEDIFLFMGKNEDMHSEKNNQIASIIIQDGVTPIYSGGALVSDSKIVVEGVIGAGDGFMVGENTSDIPEYIREKINKNIQKMNLVDKFGNCSIEWVYDGDTMWLLQMNQLNTDVDDNIVVPCDHVNDFIVFDIKDKTLNDLRELITNNGEYIKDKGIIIKGNVGISSHYGDLLRKHKIPSKIMR